MVHTRHSYVKDIQVDAKNIEDKEEINEERVGSETESHEIDIDNEENKENNDNVDDKKANEVKAEEKNEDVDEEKVIKSPMFNYKIITILSVKQRQQFSRLMMVVFKKLNWKKVLMVLSDCLCYLALK